MLSLKHPSFPEVVDRLSSCRKYVYLLHGPSLSLPSFPPAPFLKVELDFEQEVDFSDAP